MAHMCGIYDIISQKHSKLRRYSEFTRLDDDRLARETQSSDSKFACLYYSIALPVMVLSALHPHTYCNLPG